MSTSIRWPLLSGSRWLPRVVLLLTFVGSVSGCASSGTLDRPTAGGRMHSRPTLLTRAELAAPPAESSVSLYEAVLQLRPLWLNDRGPQSFLYNAAVQVALDGQLVGDIANLREFRAGDVEEARILDVAEAGSRYGLRAQSQRVIELTSRRTGYRQ
jgi:hypothetical protein